MGCCLLVYSTYWPVLYLTAKQSELGVSPSDAHCTKLPAADELVDPPVKKLAEAEEPAEPRSVDAPVLDADCAYAGAFVPSTDIANPVAKTADMIARVTFFLFIDSREY